MKHSSTIIAVAVAIGIAILAKRGAGKKSSLGSVDASTTSNVTYALPRQGSGRDGRGCC